MKKVCCNCKKESFLYPYICSGCLSRLNEFKAENIKMKTFLKEASQLLRDKGFEEESQTIDLIFNI